MTVDKLTETQLVLDQHEKRNTSFTDFAILAGLNKVAILRDDYKLVIVDILINNDNQIQSLNLSSVHDFGTQYNCKAWAVNV